MTEQKQATHVAIPLENFDKLIIYLEENDSTLRFSNELFSIIKANTKPIVIQEAKPKIVNEQTSPDTPPDTVQPPPTGG